MTYWRLKAALSVGRVQAEKLVVSAASAKKYG